MPLLPAERMTERTDMTCSPCSMPPVYRTGGFFVKMIDFSGKTQYDNNGV